MGSNIKRYRKEQRLSQAQLALMVGRDRSYISRVERGRCSATFDSIVLIANGLGIPISLLLSGVDEFIYANAPIPVHLSMSEQLPNVFIPHGKGDRASTKADEDPTLHLK